MSPLTLDELDLQKFNLIHVQRKLYFPLDKGALQDVLGTMAKMCLFAPYSW